MKILVTGGAGFIASHIVDALVTEGNQVAVVDNLSTGKMENLNPQVNFYKLDITTPELLEVMAKEKPEFVFHLAAQTDVQTSIREPLLDAQINILGTINVLEACRLNGVKKIIYSSSAAVYGTPQYLGIDEEHPVGPLSGYGVSKHTVEHYLKAYNELYGLNFTVLRYANIYGPRQDAKGEGGVIAIFVDKLMAGQQPIIYGDGEQTRDFVYVGDVVKANLKALQAGDGEIINVSCQTQTSVNELYAEIKQLIGSQLEPIYKEARNGDILHSYLNNNKIRECLSWEPSYTLSEGLQETILFFRGVV